MPMTPEDKHARRVFMHLDAIQNAISDKASMVSEAALKFYRERGGENATLPDAFAAEVARVRTELMHYISHPDSDLDTLEINAAPWPKPEDFPAEEAALVLDQALDESIGENPERVEAPADPAVDLAAENERLRARLAELEASPPPSPAVVASERMEAVKAKIDAGRATDDDDFAGVFPTWLLAEEREGESLADRIARLTKKFRSRVNELTNKLLAGEITPEEEAERDSLMDQYNMLAELGDRS